MPNHIHGIIKIDKTVNDITVETQNIASLQKQPSKFIFAKNKNKFGHQSQNLTSIIRGCKIRRIYCYAESYSRYHYHR